MKRRTRYKTLVHEAFGANCIPEESTLFQAVCGFMEGSQEGYDDNKWFVRPTLHRRNHFRREKQLFLQIRICLVFREKVHLTPDPESGKKDKFKFFPVSQVHLTPTEKSTNEAQMYDFIG